MAALWWHHSTRCVAASGRALTSEPGIAGVQEREARLRPVLRIPRTQQVKRPAAPLAEHETVLAILSDIAMPPASLNPDHGHALIAHGIGQLVGRNVHDERLGVAGAGRLAIGLGDLQRVATRAIVRRLREDGAGAVLD